MTCFSIKCHTIFNELYNFIELFYFSFTFPNFMKHSGAVLSILEQGTDRENARETRLILDGGKPLPIKSSYYSIGQLEDGIW